MLPTGAWCASHPASATFGVESSTSGSYVGRPLCASWPTAVSRFRSARTVETIFEEPFRIEVFGIVTYARPGIFERLGVVRNTAWGQFCAQEEARVVVKFDLDNEPLALTRDAIRRR